MWNGYLEGAVRAGEREARRVAEDLGALGARAGRDAPSVDRSTAAKEQ